MFWIRIPIQEPCIQIAVKSDPSANIHLAVARSSFSGSARKFFGSLASSSRTRTFTRWDLHLLASKAFTQRPFVSLYGSLPRISSTLRSRRLQFAGHCFRRVDEPIHSILYF